MFLRAEYGHFYKWLTSIGLGLVAAGVALPWFVHQATDSLTISDSEISSYTETARRVVEARQADLEFVQALLAWLVALLIILGIVVAYFGLTGWKQRQDKVDRSEDMDLAKKTFEFEQLSDPEADAQRKSEVHEEDATDVSSSAPVGPAPQEPSRVAARVAELKALEERTSELLASSFSATHKIVSRVRVKTAAGIGIQVDAIAQDPHGAWSAVVQDTIRIVHAQPPRTRVREALQRIAYVSYDIAATLLPGSEMSTEVRTTGLLLVVPEVALSDEVKSMLRAEAEQINLVLKRPVAMLVISRKQVDEMPSERYRDLIIGSLKRPGIVIFLE